MKIALCNRTKWGFIDGGWKEPESNSPMYEQRIGCDGMIVSWLFNSIVPELSKAFFYTGSTEELYLELFENFGSNNGPLLYKVQKKILELYQGNDSVVLYYTKLKRL